MCVYVSAHVCHWIEINFGQKIKFQIRWQISVECFNVYASHISIYPEESSYSKTKPQVMNQKLKIREFSTDDCILRKNQKRKRKKKPYCRSFMEHGAKYRKKNSIFEYSFSLQHISRQP